MKYATFRYDSAEVKNDLNRLIEYSLILKFLWNEWKYRVATDVDYACSLYTGSGQSIAFSGQ